MKSSCTVPASAWIGVSGVLVEKIGRELVGVLFPFRWHRRRDLKGEMSFSEEMALWVSYLVRKNLLNLET